MKKLSIATLFITINRLSPTTLVAVPLLFATFFAQADNRIISAGSAVTELIYALEAENQIVAVDSTSHYFVQGTEIPEVGYHRQLSAEGLLALNPSVLIGSDEMGPESTLHHLRSSNVDIVTLNSGDTPDDLLTRIDSVAEITGRQHNAVQLKQDIQAQLSGLEKAESATTPSVLFLMLSKGRPATVGGRDTTIDTIVSLSGAINPAHDVVSSYKPISMEAIVQMQPDYILVSERAWKSLEGITGILASFPLLAATPAGQNSAIISIPSRALIGGFGIESIHLSQQLHDTFNQ